MNWNKPTLLAALLAVIIFSSCSTASRMMKYNIPDITDTHLFPTKTINKPDTSFSFFDATAGHTLPPAILWGGSKRVNENTSVDKFLKDNATTAFLVIRNDSIIYEKYFDGYSREKQSQVFSVTKSVVSALVGIAISEGYIKNTRQPVSDFLPYFKDKGRDKLTLENLLQMTAGFSFADYKTLGKLLNLYYCEDQESCVKDLKQKYQPGTRFAYSSVATQVLGMCLEKAIGRPVTTYLEEKLWKPLGMEYDAKFTTDYTNGEAKMFCGLSASAVDLAKLARLYLNNGKWNGKQLIPEEWVLASRHADTTEGRSRRYAYCWWLDTYPRKVGYCENDFFAGGFKGQVVYVNPNDNTIIIRLGKKESGVYWPQAISKLSLIQECEEGNCASMDMLSLEGNYKGKNGKSLNLKWLNDKLMLEGFTATEKVEMKRASKMSFVNKDKNMKITVEYRNQQVKGLLLEDGDKAEFLEKI